jgi:sec-independent protein translocase protein TatA
VIIVVVVLLIIGGGKLAGLGKSLGRNIKEFKEEVSDSDKHDGEDDNSTAAG